MSQAMGDIVTAPAPPVQEAWWQNNALRTLAAATTITLAAAGCSHTPTQETASQPADAVQGADPSQPPTPLTIDKVDFRNFALDPNTCDSTGAHWPTTLVDGTGTATESGATMTVSIIGDVAYGDLNGDGSPEAVFPVMCDSGGNGDKSYSVQVYTMQGGVAKFLSKFATPHAGNVTVVKPTSVQVEDGMVVEQDAIYRANSQETVLVQNLTEKWKWTGGQFVMEVSTPTSPQTSITTAPSTTAPNTVPSTPETNSPANTISIDGIGGIKIGMSGSAVGGLGYTNETSCAPSYAVHGSAGTISFTLGNDKLIDAIQVGETDNGGPSPLKTLSGIGVGSSKDAVMKAYGDNVTDRMMQLPDNPNPVEVIVFQSPEALKKSVQLLFTVVDGKVKFITLVKIGGSPLTC